MQYQFVVIKEDDGKKAHEVLVSRHHFSRVQVKKVRLHGELLVNGQAQRMIDPLFKGDLVELKYEAESELPMDELVSMQSDIPIYYQDEWFLVVGKPAGLLTHPSYTGESDSLITRLSEYRLHPITRLDRGTSGIIILAKSGQAHYSLTNVAVEKTYLGLVIGCPSKMTGLIDAPIGRKDGSIIEREVRADGKVSQTHFDVLKTYGERLGIAAKLSFRLLTGRTHQIRVHCQNSGFPLFGDSLYPPDKACRQSLLDRVGSELYVELEKLSSNLAHQALHAYSVRFVHPYSKALLHFEMPLPEDVQSLEQALIELAGTVQ